MAQCTDCRILQTGPQRADVPENLKAFTIRDKLFGLRSITGYECRKCGALWRWHASESWVFIAVPNTRVAAKAVAGPRAGRPKADNGPSPAHS
ncbi:MAG TPA: hypothetical protein VGE51_06695 [Fontimonas sp.]